MEAKKEFCGEWAFDDPPNVAVITTTYVTHAGKPILYVSHDADDGSWQFHSSDAVSEKDAMIVALGEILEIDSSIAELANLPIGWCAIRRNSNEAWKLSKAEE